MGRFCCTESSFFAFVGVEQKENEKTKKYLV